MQIEIRDIDNFELGTFEIVGAVAFEVSDLVGSWKNPAKYQLINPNN